MLLAMRSLMVYRKSNYSAPLIPLEAALESTIWRDCLVRNQVPKTPPPASEGLLSDRAAATRAEVEPDQTWSAVVALRDVSERDR
jgi:hypothetical protein